QDECGGCVKGWGRVVGEMGIGAFVHGCIWRGLNRKLRLKKTTMIKHLIKLIWNKKRSNFLLTTEIFASFIVLFGVMSLVFYNYGNYAEPPGYDYEDVWAVY